MHYLYNFPICFPATSRDYAGCHKKVVYCTFCDGKVALAVGGAITPSQQPLYRADRRATQGLGRRPPADHISCVPMSSFALPSEAVLAEIPRTVHLQIVSPAAERPDGDSGDLKLVSRNGHDRTRAPFEGMTGLPSLVSWPLRFPRAIGPVTRCHAHHSGSVRQGAVTAVKIPMLGVSDIATATITVTA